MRRMALGKILIVFLLVLSLASCAWLKENLGIKPYSEMSAKEKVTFLLKIYNSQYDDYKMVAADPKITEAQRVTLRIKKQILIEVYPVLQALDLNVAEGKPLAPALEVKAMELLTRLGAKIK
jgi:hypothetical protein